MLLKKANEMKSNEKVLMVVLAMALIAFGFWMGNRRANRLYEYGYWTKGVIFELGTDYKGRSAFNYEFYVGGKKYTSQASGVGIRHGAFQDFIGKSFPVVYNSKDPMECNMLVRPSDFSSHGRELPDSLLWVLGCMEK
ncbi:hypothetical protein [Chitinophaga sp.]|uniref:hypothetical protein n=1 Tax=Chitinophaga sp. TaxID=1869181 RepID=UPI0031DB8016